MLRQQKKEVVLQNNVEKIALAYANMSMLKLVIRNLVGNAIKFTKQKGSVEGFSEHMGNFFVFQPKVMEWVLSKENQQKIFNKETSISHSVQSLESGTGLGLNLCKEFVQMHGGKIWIESEEGKESLFKFTLKKAR